MDYVNTPIYRFKSPKPPRDPKNLIITALMISCIYFINKIK